MPTTLMLEELRIIHELSADIARNTLESTSGEDYL